MTARVDHLRLRTARGRRGLSLIEVVVSALLVGVVLAGAMDGLGAVIRGRVVNSDRGRAAQLAQQLMTEILAKAYADPERPGDMGRDPGEPARDRESFDDVDDYRAWSASPPEHADGSPLAGAESWRRTVEVDWAEPDSPLRTASTESGLKRVVVTVAKDGDVLQELTAYRSEAHGP